MQQLASEQRRRVEDGGVHIFGACPDFSFFPLVYWFLLIPS